MNFRECCYSLLRLRFRVAVGLLFCLAGFLLLLPTDAVCKVGDFYQQKVTGSVGGKMGKDPVGNASSRKSGDGFGNASAGGPGSEAGKTAVNNADKDKPMTMYSKGLDKALEEAQHNPKGSEEILAGENTPLALCYRAYLRESGAIVPSGPEDSAEALLNRALQQLPEELRRQATDSTDWGGIGPTMNCIINTLFILHTNNLKPE